MSISEQESNRDSAIGSKLIAVGDATEKWAKASKDGLMVWEVAAELLPAMWRDWRSNLQADTWRVNGDLVRTLDEIAQACNDGGVTAAIDSAKMALNNYVE